MLTALGRTLAFVLTFNFFLFRAAGDPHRTSCATRSMTRGASSSLIEERGLDESLLEQFRIYVRNTLTGELETSYSSPTARAPTSSRTRCRTR